MADCGRRCRLILAWLVVLVLSACGGGGEVATENPSSGSPPNAVALSVSVVGVGSVASTAAGIACGAGQADCAEDLAAGTTVELVATPAAGNRLVGWTGAAARCAEAPNCSVLVDSAMAVSAVFAPLAAANQQLDLTIEGNGRVLSSADDRSCATACTSFVASGTEVVLTAQPVEGYAFAGWSVVGASCAGTGECRVLMDTTRSVVARFVPLPVLLSVTVSGSGAVGSSPAGITCTADCSQSFPFGSEVTLGAQPAAGFEFAGWSGACSGTGACTVNLAAAQTVGATFTPVAPTRYALNVVALADAGTVTSEPAGIGCGTDCSEAYDAGTNVVLSAVPRPGYAFTGWTGAGCAGTGTCSVAMSGVATVAASFVRLNQVLTVSRQGSGLVSSTPAGISCGSGCSAAYPAGSSVSLTAAPAAGYSFTAWSGACSGSGACAVGMDVARSVVATFTLNRYAVSVTKVGAGTVTSNVGGIDCGATCSASLDHGSGVTLTATPAAGYSFSGWSGGACAGTGSCTLTVDGVKAVTASFTLNRHALSVNKAGAGSVTSNVGGIGCGATCSAVFDHGSSVTLSAVADTGYSFSGWSGACTGTGACVVAMDAVKSVTASFAINHYALSLSKTGSGTITSDTGGLACGAVCSASFDHGSSVTLSATADTGYTFTGWTGGGCSGTGTCVVTMDVARSVVATFTVNRYAVTVQKAGFGTVVANTGGLNCGATCVANYNHGSSVTLSATPATGYTFTGWSGGACSGTAACTLTVDAAKAVSATFTINRYGLSVNKVGVGSVSSSAGGIDCGAACSASFDHGSSVTLSATAAAGYTFTGWAGACTGTAACVVTMDAAKSVTASFTLNRYALSVATTGTGTVTSSVGGISCGASCSASFDHGSTVTLSAAAGTGHTFTGWSGGVCVGTGPCVVTMDAAKSVTANFAINRYVLNVSKVGSGTIGANVGGINCGATCSATFDHGSSVTLSATAATGYTFTGWGGACSGTAACVVTMDAAKSVTATFTLNRYALTVGKTGSGTVTSSVGGIGCGATCSASFDHGSSVTLSATAATGYTFTGWSGACSGTGACVVTMDAVKTVTAAFTINRYALTVGKTGSGTVASDVGGISCGATCSASYDHGSSVTLSATAAIGYTFTGWSGGGCTGTAACVVTVDAAKTVSATFTINRYVLSVNKVGTGTVAAIGGVINCGALCSASFDHGSSVTLTATAATGYTFTGWSGGVCSGTANCVVTVDAAKSVTATFTINRYALTVGKTGSGTVTSSVGGINCGATCSASYDHGSSVSLSGTAATGYTFTGWSGGGCSGTGTCVVTMDAAKNVTATFTINRYALTVGKTGSGMVASDVGGISCGATCSASYDHGTSVTLSATASTGYTFTGWSGGGCTGTATCVMTVDAAKTVSATFTINRYVLSVIKVGSGTVAATGGVINCGALCSASFDHGSSVTLTATPGTGYTFAGWSGGVCSGTASCVVTVDAAKSVTATFTINRYSLTVGKTGSGTVTSNVGGISCGATCSASYDHGSAVTLSAAPSAGFSFSGWSGGGCTGTGTCVVTMDAAKTVTATFTQITYALSVTINGVGGVGLAPGPIQCAANCSNSFNSGTVVTLAAAPADGYAFTGWSGGVCSGTGTCTLTMDAAKSVTATFTPFTSYALTVHVSGSGTVASLPAGIACGTTCIGSFAPASTVLLTATPATGQQFSGWSGACSGTADCSVTMSQAKAVGATFAPQANGRFQARPFLFKADEVRLRASIARGDAEATGPAGNTPGQPLGFISLIRAAAANRASYSDVATWHIALAGWLLNDVAMQRQARDEAMAIVAAAPNGDSGTGGDFQHVEDRLLEVAATADLAYSQFSAAQLAQVATFVNGTLNNWNTQNLSFWPFDDPLNNYWQNGILAHVVGAVATEGFNAQAANWRTKAEAMAAKFIAATNAPNWSGPVQSEGHYYAGYVTHALWALELYDAAVGTSFVASSKFSAAEHLDMLMYQTRPHLNEFFEVGSEANVATAPHTFLSLSYWHHLISTGRFTAQAQQAKAILNYIHNSADAPFWPRWSKSFANFYWNIAAVPTVALTAKTDRLYAAPSPGAGLIGVRSSAGFQPTARAALMFATQFAGSPAYSHANVDAPGFQWGDGADWLVTDPEYFNSSGVLAEAGTNTLSDVSNFVTLAGYKQNLSGVQPRVVFAEDNQAAAVPHAYVQINAQPYWTMTSTYRRDYVWLDDLRVLVLWDRIVGAPAKKWRLHVAAAPTVNGRTASYTVNGKTVTVRDVLSPSAGAWVVENLSPAVTTSSVWRLSQDDAASDYRSLKVLDVGGRVSAATLSSGTGFSQVNLTINGVARSVRFHDDGTHALVQ